jgi:hypothetical protein
MRFGGAPVAAAAGDVIDAAVACQVRAKRVFALDLAARRLERVIGEEFGARIGGTACPEQCRTDLSTLPEIVRSHEASPPDAKGALSRFALVVCEAAEGVDVNRPALPHQPVLKVDATHGAIANPAPRKLRIGAEVATDDAAVRDKLLKGFNRKQAAGISPAMVNAILIELRCVDAIETVNRAIDGKCIGVIRSRRGERQQQNGEHEHQTHRGHRVFERNSSAGHIASQSGVSRAAHALCKTHPLLSLVLTAPEPHARGAVS